jgi:hypothetical protein
VILAALGAQFHWSRAELEALTAADAAFWVHALRGWQERLREGVEA